MTTETQPVTSKKLLPKAPSKLSLWFPAAEWIRKYDWGTNLTPDLIAAISVAALLIPESMGYATIAGVPVQMGLYAAPLALIAYAMFGGSRLMVFAAAGATSAISVTTILPGTVENLTTWSMLESTSSCLSTGAYPAKAAMPLTAGPIQGLLL